MRKTGVVLIAIASLAAACTSSKPAGSAGGSGPAAPRFASAALTSATRVCGVTDNASITSRATPTVKPTVLASKTSPRALVVDGSTLSVLDTDKSLVTRYDTNGKVTSTTHLPATVAPFLAVDNDRNSYVLQGVSTLVKVNASGKQVWSKSLPNPMLSLYSTGKGSSEHIVVPGQTAANGLVFDLSGKQVGTTSVIGGIATQTSSGTLIDDASRVRTYANDGTLQRALGTSSMANDPMPAGGPFHFYQLGAAVPYQGGLLVADAGDGLVQLDADGDIIGHVDQADLGGLTERPPMAIFGGRLYYASGVRFTPAQDQLSSLPLSAVSTLLTKPREPFPWLGVGAGLLTSRPGQYFPAGTTPTVKAVFDSWYATRASKLSLAYVVRNAQQAAANTPETVRSSAVTASNGMISPVALTLPSATPGAYEIDARLVSQGKVVGATCLDYTVGAPGQKLDLAALPSGADFGGAAPERAVALSSELGNDAVRVQLNFSALEPSPGAPLDYGSTDAPLKAAAALAASKGVALWVQVGSGGTAEDAAVKSGTWGALVGQLVAHYKGVVNTWEAWNEPNNTYQGTPAQFVANVMAPFYKAVKAVDPSEKVIGGTAIGPAAAWWTGFAAAGGFHDLDIVGFHPYTGHNRSWEEQGTVADIQAIMKIAQDGGYTGGQFWITESAWWSNGATNYWDQAHKVARAALWQLQLGIQKWAYFLPEGGYGDDGLSYSLIQSDGTTDNFVKPGALAMMTSHNVLDGMHFVSDVPIDEPGVYGMTLAGSSGKVLALWTDDLQTRLALKVPSSTSITDVSELGATNTAKVNAGTYGLDVGPAVTYLKLPSGVSLGVAPTESFGPDLLRATGTTAAATSSATTNPPALAIDGVDTAAGAADLSSVRGWASAPGNTTSALTVTLAAPQSVNRVQVVTHSLGSVVPGLRSYTVDLLDAEGTVLATASVKNEFSLRRMTLTFPPTLTASIRLTATAVNTTGFDAGARPWFWPTDAMDAEPSAVVDEIEAFSGTDQPRAASGDGLKLLF